MWDDVIIGSGDTGNSAISVPESKFKHDTIGLSENRVSYWVSGCFLGIGMTIMKDTKDGASLTYMLSDNMSNDFIAAFLDGLALEYIDKGRLRQKVKEAMREAYRAGSESRARKIRSALGVS